jgi:hypothetical protein
MEKDILSLEEEVVELMKTPKSLNINTHRCGYYNTVLIKSLQKGEIIVEFDGILADDYMGRTFLQIAFPKSKFIKPTKYKYYIGNLGKGRGYNRLSKELKKLPIIKFYDLFRIDVKKPVLMFNNTCSHT